jgi:hypothetical protein
MWAPVKKHEKRKKSDEGPIFEPPSDRFPRAGTLK